MSRFEKSSFTVAYMRDREAKAYSPRYKTTRDENYIPDY